MSILDKIGKTAAEFGDSVQGVFTFAPGVIWDAGTMVFNDKDESFGDLVDQTAGRATDLLDPLLNNETLTGLGFTKAMEAMEYLYRENYSEPAAAVGTILGHVGYNPVENWTDIFSGKAWGDAYQVAQNRSPGQAYALTGLSVGRGFVSDETNQQIAEKMDDWGLGAFQSGYMDPLDERAWRQMNKNASVIPNVMSGTSDFVSRWYMDPGVLLGKGLGKGLEGVRRGKITDLEKNEGIRRVLDGEIRAQHGFSPMGLQQSLKNVTGNDTKTRIEKVFDFMETGANGAPLNSTQMFVGIPELRDARIGGRRLAGLLEEAGKIENQAVRRDEWRRIMSVAMGDFDEAFRSADELSGLRHISDELKNMAKGNVVDLKTTALGEEILANPVLHASLEGQLTRQPQIRAALDTHVKRLEMLVGKFGDDALEEGVEAGDTGLVGILPEAPGVARKGKRAVARDMGQGLLRDGTAASGFKSFDKAANVTMEAARRLAKNETLQTVYQTSPFAVPARIVTPVANIAGKAALAYARVPMKVTDSLRSIHPTGVVNLHDWDGAQSQLDGMLQQSVAPGERWRLMGKAALARTEGEKQALIEEVEHASIMGLAEKYNIVPKARAAAESEGKEFTSDYVRDFVSEVVRRGNKKRAVHMAPRTGRAYSAALNGGEQMADQAKALRVDQKVIDIDEHGVPNIMSNPILETQLANSVPLVDLARIETVLKRDNRFFKRHAQAWADMRVEADRLSELKRKGGHVADSTINGVYSAMDNLADAAMAATRVWKYSVLFRLGYPIRIVLDDHARIWSQIGAGSVMGAYKEGALARASHNWKGRRAQVTEQRAALMAERDNLEGLVSDEGVAEWVARDEEIRNLNRRIDQLSSGVRHSKSKSDPVTEKRKAAREKVRALKLERDTKMEQQGLPPEAIRARLRDIDEQLRVSSGKARRQIAKQRGGESDITLGDGTTAQGAFGGLFGDAWRKQAASNEMWREGMLDHEGKLHQSFTSAGGWRVIDPHEDEVVHLTAWSDAVNNQIRQSKVAMHFVDGGDVQSFTRWLKEPSQRQLRERMAHYANDPEDWGSRVEQLVDQYLPTQEMRDLVRKGRLSKDDLKNLWPNQATRPAVHGATLSFNIGNHPLAQATGNTFKWLFKHLSETPTDKLSRHPYFAAVYKSELNALHMQAKAQAGKAGRMYGDKDLRAMENIARKRAMSSLKKTLFDIESHSGAAHFMRFISPFFAAHQEAMQRWWRIISENPQVIRRIQQTFDMPRKLGLVVDENGDPVKSGDTIGEGHSVMLRIPDQLGGRSKFGKWFNDLAATEGWKFSENSMNLLLQSGSPLNPGVGPYVSVPAEGLLHKLQDKKKLENFVRLLNPYDSDSAWEQLIPSTVSRLWTLIRGEKSGEFLDMWNTNMGDMLVQHLEKTDGRWPTDEERVAMLERANDETHTESILRFFQNFLSPFPARPGSKFAAIQGGWRKIREQMDAEGRSFDWALDQFKAQYGDVYLPLIQSNSVNISNMPITNRAVASFRQHKDLLKHVDPRLHGAVIGPEGAYTDEDSYSRAAAQFFRTTPMKSSSPDDKYLSYNDPEAAFVAAAERQGWSEYGDVMDSLTAAAVDQGLTSWRDSEALTQAREQAVLALKERNTVWAEDYDTGLQNPKAYDYALEDLKRIASNRALTSDPARQDVQVLRAYLKVRDFFGKALEARAAAGGHTTMQAESNADLQRMYISVLNYLEESNTDFQRYFVNGTIDRDPFLRTEDPQLASMVG